MADKTLVFISHITEEAKLANILKSHLEEAFLRMVDIFVSSDSKSIVPGDPWLNKIVHALQNASLALILCSQRSIKRPWINFEAGACWVRDVPIIPVCHTDLHPGGLPNPLNSLQAIEASRESGLRQVTQRIAQEIGCKPPSVDLNVIVEKIKSFEESYRNLPEVDITAQAGWDSEKLKSLRREAMAALRCKPEDTLLFEHKLHEIDLLDEIPNQIKVKILDELGLEVTLNSDEGTRLLVEHLMWQIAPTDWTSISLAEEIIGDVENGRQLLETISSVLWTWGVQAIEYGLSKQTVNEIIDAIAEVRAKAILLEAKQAQYDCRSALSAMLGKAKSENRHDIIDILNSSIEE